ncbi:hypothetical protein KSS87_019070 [Heliosperma pusillum]|nr:hypothetical protein KSS87_019070 [Heliosperma pusillum]
MCLGTSKLNGSVQTLKQYKTAKLTPIEAGCCTPPSECGYPAVNASYYDLSYHPASSNKDCKLYKNSKIVKCYNCNSCKAGVAQYMKMEWRVVAIFNVVLFFVLCTLWDAVHGGMLPLLKFDSWVCFPNCALEVNGAAYQTPYTKAVWIMENNSCTGSFSWNSD